MNNLTKAQKEALTHQLTNYLQDELAIEIGGFDAEFLTDFIIEKFSPYFYNQGLADAQLMVQKQMDNVIDAVDELVKGVD